MKYIYNKKTYIMGMLLVLLIGFFAYVVNVTASSLVAFSYSSNNYYTGQTATYTFNYTVPNTVQADDYIASIIFPVGFSTSGVTLPDVSVTIDGAPATIDSFSNVGETGALISLDIAVMPNSAVVVSIADVTNPGSSGVYIFNIPIKTVNLVNEDIDSIMADPVTIVDLDITPPTIVSVDSTTLDGAYTIDDVIDITVLFSEIVAEGAEPTTLTFETGTIDQTCQLTFAGDNTANCSITIVAGDNSSDLTVSSISSKATDENSNIISDTTPATNLDSLRNIIIDTQGPTLSISSPLDSGTINNVTNNSAITFSTDEALASGTLTLTRTGGTADLSSPRVCTLLGTSLQTGVHTLDLSDTTNSCTNDISDLVSGTIYTLVISGTDTVGNNGGFTTTGVTFLIDSIPPSVSITSPINNTIINNVTNDSAITVNNGEAIASGTVTITRTSGTADGNSPHICTLTGSALSSGLQTINLATSCTSDVSNLVSNTVYTITFSASDSNGNESEPVARIGITFDNTVPTLAITTPTDNATIDDVTTESDIAISNSESLTSATLTLTRTGGTADPNSPHVCTLTGSALDSGAHTLDLSDTVNSCTSDVSDLVSDAVYDITYVGTDPAGNTNTTVLVTDVLFQLSDVIVPPPMDTDAPIIAEVTPIASVVTETTAVYTFSTNEIGTVTIDACNPDISVNMDEITASTITLSNMTNGLTYECSFTVTDAANNVSNTLTIGPFTIVLSSGRSSSLVTRALQNNQTEYIVLSPTITIPTLTTLELIKNNLDNKKQCLVGSYVFTQNMKKWTTDGFFNEYTNAIAKEVKKLQTVLNSLGFNSGKTDGIFGPITESAVMNLQKFWNTTPDGIVGAETRALLNPCPQI